MRRREFITLVGAAAWPLAAWPVAACTQQGDRVRALQLQILRLQAEEVAEKIGLFIKEIENQMGWTIQLTWSASTIEQWHFDGLRLLRQVPAITEFRQLDPSGKQRLHTSRLAMRAGYRRFLPSDFDMNRRSFCENLQIQTLFGCNGRNWLRPGLNFILTRRVRSDGQWPPTSRHRGASSGRRANVERDLRATANRRHQAVCSCVVLQAGESALSFVLN